MALVVLFLLTGMVVYAGNSMLQKEADRISRARADQAILQERLKLKEDLQRTIKEFDELEQLAETFLPDAKNQDDLIAEFYKISSANGIKPAGISFNASGEKVGGNSQTKPLKDSKDVLIFPFNVQNYTADFNQLIAYLQALETNRRKLQITQIELQPDPVSGKIVVPSMSMESYLKGPVLSNAK